MATSIRSSSIGGAQTGTALSVSAPSGTTVGDVVVCIIATNYIASNNVTDNNGSTPFTQDMANTNYAGGGGGLWNIYSRRIQAGDPSTYAFTQGSSARWTVIAIAFKNPDPTTIYDVSPVSGNFSGASSGTTLTAPSITTSTNGSINIVVGAIDNAGQSITATPAGYTVLQNGVTANTSQIEAAVALTITTAGATGSKTFTQSINGNWGAGQFAIKNHPQGATSGSMMLNMDVG